MLKRIYLIWREAIGIINQEWKLLRNLLETTILKWNRRIKINL